MKKILYLFSMLISAMAILSCSKQEGPAGPENQQIAENDGPLVTATFKLNSYAGETKAVSISDDQDDTIDKLELYWFDSSGNILGHYHVTQEELDANEIHMQFKAGTEHYYIFLANIDSETAERLASYNASDWNSSSKTHIPLSAGNYSTHRLPLCGSAYVYYNDDKTYTVNMYRYMYKIDVKDITVDFDDESWMSKDIFVKSISLTNTGNMFCFLHSWPFWMYLDDYIGTEDFFFLKNSKYSIPSFGGITDYICSNFAHCSYPSSTNTLSNATGKLAGSFPYYLNNNYQQDKGVLNITATGDLIEATYHSYSEGTGQVCSSTSTVSHTLNVNRTFYGLPIGNYNVADGNIVCAYNKQDGSTKLVIELSVDGQTCFYPIQVFMPQPNTHYVIDKITLKSPGSEYSNFYMIQYKADFSVHVEDWHSVAISNIDCGEDE